MTPPLQSGTPATKDLLWLTLILGQSIRWLITPPTQVRLT